jgi:O-antigen/teichoic acid export membrane protein
MISQAATVAPNLSLKRRVVRGAFGGLVTSVLANGFLFVGQLIIPRVLSRPEYAQFTVSISFVALFALFADLGITPMIMREFATAEEGAQSGVDRRGLILGSALALRLFLSVIVACAVLIVSPLLYSSDMASNMGIVLVALVISSRMLVVRSVGEAFLRAHGRYYLASSFALVDAIAFALLLFVFRTSDITVSGVLWIYVLCNVPGFILLAWWIARWLRAENLRLAVDLSLAKRFVMLGVPLSLGTAFLTIHNQADTLLLDRLSTPIEVSSFAAMVRLSAAVLPIPAVLSGVIAPELTKLLQRGDLVRSRKLVDLSLRVLLVTAGAIALFLLPSSEQVALLFLGEKYVSAAPLLKLVGWMLMPIFIATFMTEMSVAAGTFWPVAVYTAFIMIAVIVGDLFLIVPYGASGAMISKLVAVSLGVITLFIIQRRANYIDIPGVLLDLLKIGVCIAVGLIIGSLMNGAGANPFVAAIASLGGYILSAFALRVLVLSELRALDVWRARE